MASELAEVLLELLGSKLVIDKTTESDCVTEHLKTADGIAEDDNGRHDQQDIFQDTGQREDEG